MFIDGVFVADDDGDCVIINDEKTTNVSSITTTMTNRGRKNEGTINNTTSHQENHPSLPVQSFKIKAHSWLRDPFVVVLSSNPPPTNRNNNKQIKLEDEFPDDKYLLFGTSDEPPPNESAYSAYEGSGFHFFSSKSLLGPWNGPFCAFEKDDEFPFKTQFWAPEVIRYGEYYYLVASFRGENCRRIQILKSASPKGKFKPFSLPITPSSWYCLDGTLYLGESEPILIFCREWIEVNDGEIYAVKLSNNLERMISEPVLLFKASQAKWTKPINSKKSYVTDGPFIWKSRMTGEILMLWSSISYNGNYNVGVSRSKSNDTVFSEWVHDEDPLFDRNAFDGGHCMLFRPLVGDGSIKQIWDGVGPPPLVMALHTPNKNANKSNTLFVRVNEEVSQDGKKLHLRILY